MRWRTANAVNESIDRQIDGGFFFYGQWQISSPIAITEGDETSMWQGIAFETLLTDVGWTNQCRPRGSIGLYAWRPLPDSSGIDAIALYTQIPESDDYRVFGTWAGCPAPQLGAGAGPVLFRFKRRREKITDHWTAVAGAAHVEPIGKGASGPECRLQSGRLYFRECEEITMGATVRATLRQSSLTGDTSSLPTHAITIGPAAVVGVRRFERCDPHYCLPPSSAKTPLLRHGSQLFPLLGMADRYLATWRDSSVLRTTVMLRFGPRESDARIRDVFRRWGMAVESTGPAGSYYVTVPDPGPAVGAYDRMLARLAGERGVRAVYPLRARRWTPIADPGRVIARVVGPTGTPVTNGLVCFSWLPSPEQEPPPWCRRTNRQGSATFDSMPTWDYWFTASCPNPDGKWTVADSIDVRVEPAKTATVRFRPVACHQR
jgi:hypothetical protein